MLCEPIFKKILDEKVRESGRMYKRTKVDKLGDSAKKKSWTKDALDRKPVTSSFSVQLHIFQQKPGLHPTLVIMIFIWL